MTLRKHDAKGPDPKDLRQEALRRLRRHRPEDLSALDPADLQALIHELEVHQVELEVQNEELRRAQADLADARNRYEDLYELAPVGYLTLDRQGKILQVNLTAAKLLCDMDRRALIGRRIERLLVMQDRDSCYALLRDTATQGAVRTKEFRLACPDGTTRWVSATASSQEGSAGQAPGFRVTLSDIHERKAAEEALRQREQQLQELAGTLEARVLERTGQLHVLAGQLSQAEQRERHRLAKVLHDHLQQLLVGAKFSLSMLRRQVTDEALLPAVQRVGDLLDESMTTSRSLTAELSPPILYQGTMRQVLEWLARWMHDKHGLQVQLEVDEKAHPRQEEIRVLVFEIVRELLLNVIKHAQVRSAAVHMTCVDGRQVQVVVADEGVGFDPSEARPKAEGAFGLMSVRERLGVFSGRIEIDSAPGKGSRIKLVVPTDLQMAAVEDVVGPAAVLSLPAGESATAGAGTGARVASGRPPRIRVLLADDHAVVRDGLARLLLVQRDMEVIGQAEDGLQARDMALQLQPDVVIMDVSMPGLSGMDATRQILSRLPDTRIIGLSMHAEPDIAKAMREAGAVAYLAKSSQPEVLVNTIRQHAGKATARAET